MEIYDKLNILNKLEKNAKACAFNGYLEDYLNVISESNVHYELFKKIFELDNDMMIIKDLKFSKPDKKSVPNIMIKYKDIFKLDDEAFKIPYVLYSKKDNQSKAIFLADNYYIAKALFIINTDAKALYHDLRNDIIASDLSDDVIEVIEKMYDDKASLIQRNLDKKHFNNFDDLYNDISILSKNLNDNIQNKIIESGKRKSLIENFILTTFLLKRLVYVSYMTNRKILVDIHNNDSKAQREKAVKLTKDIRYISYYELWSTK